MADRPGPAGGTGPAGGPGKSGASPLIEATPAPAPYGPPLLAPVLTQPARPPDADVKDPAEQARSKRRWTLIGLAAVGLSVIIALTLTLLVVTAPLPPAKVAVPDVSGMSLEQAVVTLQEKHLTLGTVTRIDAPERDPGKIVNQRPSERTQVDQDTPVNVEIDNS